MPMIRSRMAMTIANGQGAVKVGSTTRSCFRTYQYWMIPDSAPSKPRIMKLTPKKNGVCIESMAFPVCFR